MNHEAYKEQLSAFLDGELNEAERGAVLAHLETCEACRKYFAELTAMHEALGGMEDCDAPEGFADGVMARLHEEAAEKPKRRISWKRRAALAACAAAAVLAISAIPRGAFFGGGNGAPSDSSASGGASESLMVQNTTAASAPAAAEAADRDGLTEEAEETGPDEPAEAQMLDTGASGEMNEYTTITGVYDDAEPELRNSDASEPLVLTLSGAGAAEWLAANSFSDEGGVYAVTDEALYNLPEGLTLGDDEAVERWRRQDVNFASVRAAETEAAP